MVFTPAMLKLLLECHKSVLGSMLFLLYINDINNAITSQIKFFADDSVLYINLRNKNDQVIIQNYLDTISSWAENC